MLKAVYIVGGIATFFALLAAILFVMFGLTIGGALPVTVMVLIALVYLAGPITAIVLGRRSRPGVGLAMAIASLLMSLGVLAVLPVIIGAAAQP